MAQDWREDTLQRVRELIEAAVPDVVEEAKWVKPTNPAGVPTWSHHGTICTGETYRTYVKLTFTIRGAPSTSTRATSSMPARSRRW